jgi:nitrate reductase beta subunit
MLTKQEEEALTTSAQATAQYVADLSEIPAVQEQMKAEAPISVPTSNVAQLELPQDYQAHFSAAQAQAVAQAAAAAMTQANNGNYSVDFTGATSANMDSQSGMSTPQGSNDMYRKTMISDKVTGQKP